MLAPFHFWSLNIILIWAAFATGLPLSSFYPFGLSVNDSLLTKSDDDSSAPIMLPSPLTFFGSSYQRLQVRDLYNPCSDIISIMGERVWSWELV